jgi:hypothetical protein
VSELDFHGGIESRTGAADFDAELQQHINRLDTRLARRDIKNAALGVLDETIDRTSVSGGLPLGAAGATNTVYLGLVGLRVGDTVNGVTCFCTAVGAGVTKLEVGLYSSTGAFLAFTGDFRADLVAGSLIPEELAPPYEIVSDDGYYVGVLAIASTTVPSLGGCTLADQALDSYSGRVGTLAVAPTAQGQFAAVTGQSTLGADLDLTNSATDSAFWFAIS